MNSHEAWYAANLECQRQCKQWQEAIAHRQAERASVQAHYAKQLQAVDRAILQTKCRTHGKAGKDMARNSKVAIVEYLVQVKLDEIDTRIAELQRQIKEHAPSPYWRQEKHA